MSAAKVSAPPRGWVLVRLGDAYEGGPCPCGAPLEAGGAALLNATLRAWACSSSCALKGAAAAAAPRQEQTQLPVWLGGSK